MDPQDTYVSIMNYATTIIGRFSHRRFVGTFGTSISVASYLWYLLQDTRPRGSSCKHMLWALMFLKTYDTEHQIHNVLQVDEKTMRKWVWKFIDLISNLDIVRFFRCIFFLRHMTCVDLLGETPDGYKCASTMQNVARWNRLSNPRANAF